MPVTADRGPLPHCLASLTRSTWDRAEGHPHRKLGLPRDPPSVPPAPPRRLTLAGDKLGEHQGTGTVPSLLATLLCGLSLRACWGGKAEAVGQEIKVTPG